MAINKHHFPSITITFVLFWFLNLFAAIWVWITLLPTQILNAERKDKPIGMRDYIGWGLFVVGFILEATADYQKAAFRQDPNNVVCGCRVLVLYCIH